MRFTKMLGLAAVMAMIVAAVGVSSASAGNTALCDEHVELACPAGHVITGHIEGTANEALLLTSLLNVECNNSALLGNALGLASPQVTHVESFTFSECVRTDNGKACEATATALGTLLTLKTGLNLGTVEAHGTNVLVKCGTFLHCVYGGLPKLHATGSEGGSLGVIETTESTVLTKISGFLCPSTSSWDAEYVIALPDEGYITS